RRARLQLVLVLLPLRRRHRADALRVPQPCRSGARPGAERHLRPPERPRPPRLTLRGAPRPARARCRREGLAARLAAARGDSTPAAQPALARPRPARPRCAAADLLGGRRECYGDETRALLCRAELPVAWQWRARGPSEASAVGSLSCPCAL